MSDPFFHPELRDWFFSQFEPPDELTDGTHRVALEGSGPFDLEDFQQFLLRAGIDAVLLADPDDPVADEILVLGREQVRGSLLEWIVEAREGQRLRVYSQEMFLSYWATAFDPFDANPSVLDCFREGHEGLLELTKQPAFDWPSARVSSGHDPFDGDEPLGPLEGSPPIGVLKAMGYSVRSPNPGPQWRRAKLSAAFMQDLTTIRSQLDLPLSEADAYLDQWGAPGTARRLQRIAQSLAAFARNGTRRGPTMDAAVGLWIDDLSWLKKEFYDDTFGKGRDWWPTARP